MVKIIGKDLVDFNPRSRVGSDSNPDYVGEYATIISIHAPA